ncbi:MAG TPA: TetR/AcrR family transcriptional regulator, partial [Gemmatimonas sp.]|nr:TetR/AcrR family transcriptional regulator [Gemmatimonas sp.]
MTRGRPREFDTNSALDQALLVFVRDGFAHASVQDLADSMGICKPSLYAAYGNKEALFIEALRRYASAGNTRRATLLDSEPNGERAATLLLEDAAHAYTNCDS